jgi:SNF2 family DNA or RNA helicase
MREDKNKVKQATPNGRALRALEILSFNPLLGYLHKVVPYAKRTSTDDEDFFESDDEEPDPEDAYSEDEEGTAKSPSKKKAKETRATKTQEPSAIDTLEMKPLPEDEERFNQDRESWFYDQSDISKEMPAHDSKGSRIRWLLKRIKQGGDGFEAYAALPSPSKIDRMKDRHLAELFMSYSPKLQATVSILCDYTLVRNEKVIVWFQYPIIQELVEEILDLLGVPTMSMYASSTTAQRQTIQQNLNDVRHRGRVFLCGMRTGGVGWNFQTGCRVCIVFDCTISMDQEHQVRGRVFRIGQDRTVLFFQLVVSGTNNSRTIRYVSCPSHWGDRGSLPGAPL